MPQVYASRCAVQPLWISNGTTTYKKARLTLLQPIRTEVFKQQLQAFADVLAAVRYRELELREQFAFRDLIELNTLAMFDAYAFRFFDLEVPLEQRPYNFAQCPESTLIAHPDGSYPDLMKDEDHIRRDKIEPKKADPNARAAIWSRHMHNNVRLPKRFISKLAEIRKVADSPLITKELAKRISDLEEAVQKNIISLSTVLTEVAKEMPEKYPNLETLQKSSFGWILNRYNERFIHLEPKSEAIAEYMRDYFKVEDLLA